MPEPATTTAVSASERPASSGSGRSTPSIPDISYEDGVSTIRVTTKDLPNTRPSIAPLIKSSTIPAIVPTAKITTPAVYGTPHFGSIRVSTLDRHSSKLNKLGKNNKLTSSTPDISKNETAPSIPSQNKHQIISKPAVVTPIQDTEYGYVQSIVSSQSELDKTKSKPSAPQTGKSQLLPTQTFVLNSKQDSNNNLELDTIELRKISSNSDTNKTSALANGDVAKLHNVGYTNKGLQGDDLSTVKAPIHEPPPKIPATPAPSALRKISLDNNNRNKKVSWNEKVVVTEESNSDSYTSGLQAEDHIFTPIDGGKAMKDGSWQGPTHTVTAAPAPLANKTIKQDHVQVVPVIQDTDYEQITNIEPMTNGGSKISKSHELDLSSLGLGSADLEGMPGEPMFSYSGATGCCRTARCSIILIVLLTCSIIAALVLAILYALK